MYQEQMSKLLGLLLIAIIFQYNWVTRNQIVRDYEKGIYVIASLNSRFMVIITLRQFTNTCLTGFN